MCDFYIPACKHGISRMVKTEKDLVLGMWILLVEVKVSLGPQVTEGQTVKLCIHEISRKKKVLSLI